MTCNSKATRYYKWLLVHVTALLFSLADYNMFTGICGCMCNYIKIISN